jgi:prophage regulatory protein
MDDDVIITNNELRKIKRDSTKRNNPRIASEKSPFLGRDQVLELVPVGKSTLYLMMAAGEFPKPKKLGGRAAAWSKAEVEAWIAEKLSNAQGEGSAPLLAQTPSTAGLGGK